MSDSGYPIDLAAEWLESDSMPPPPMPPSYPYFVEVRRDTVKMRKAEIQAAIEDISEEDLADYEP